MCNIFRNNYYILRISIVGCSDARYISAYAFRSAVKQEAHPGLLLTIQSLMLSAPYIPSDIGSLLFRMVHGKLRSRKRRWRSPSHSHEKICKTVHWHPARSIGTEPHHHKRCVFHGIPVQKSMNAGYTWPTHMNVPMGVFCFASTSHLPV